MFFDIYSSAYKNCTYTRVDLVRKTPGFKTFRMQLGENSLLLLRDALAMMQTFDLRKSSLEKHPIRLPVGEGLVLAALVKISERNNVSYRSLEIIRSPKNLDKEEEEEDKGVEDGEGFQKPTEPRKDFVFWIRFELLSSMVEALNYILRVNDML